MLLRGSLSVGKKRSVTQPKVLDLSAVKEDTGLKIENPFEDSYLELADGEYLSPHMFEIFPQHHRTQDGDLRVTYLQESYVLEIPLTDKVAEFLKRYEHHDFYKKIVYFS